jgi:hypothetical protein
MPDTTKSLTYAELATALGLTAGSVRNLVRRKRWPRHAGNDGATRVVVPIEVLDEAASRPWPHDGVSNGATVAPTGNPTEGGTHLAAMAMIERHVARLESEVATLAAKAAALESERDAERAVAAQVALQVGALQATLETVREDTARLREERDTAQAKIEVLSPLEGELTALKSLAEELRNERDRLLERLMTRTSVPSVPPALSLWDLIRRLLAAGSRGRSA